MIGYYVHHVGGGHLRTAQCIAAALHDDVTGLSSLPRPAGWHGSWIELPRDDAGGPARDPTAGGRLHWVPLDDAGLADRMARIAAWVATTRPSVVVVDVSVEVAVLVRLLGVPVVVAALPGDRSDPAHQLGYSLADAVLASWPAGLDGLDTDLRPWADCVHHVGGLTRFAGRRAPERPTVARRVLVLQGVAGTSCGPAELAAAAQATPDLEWRRIGPGAWVEDPWPELCAADVVVTHAGLGALADVAAARRPAVVIAEDRPHDEQRTTARALQTAGLAVVVQRWPDRTDWPALIDRATALGGAGWDRWQTAGAAQRAARVVEQVAGRSHRGAACG